MSEDHDCELKYGQMQCKICHRTADDLSTQNGSVHASMPVEAFSLSERVGLSWSMNRKPKDVMQKARFDMAIRILGKRPAEIYKPLGIDKSDWSRITWGIIIPDDMTKIRIAKALGCDSAALWGNVTFKVLQPGEEGKNDSTV